MRKRLNVLLALVTGKAIVIAQSPEEKVAGVLVGMRDRDFQKLVGFH